MVFDLCTSVPQPVSVNKFRNDLVLGVLIREAQLRGRGVFSGVFLASDAASAVTAQSINVDCGVFPH